MKFKFTKHFADENYENLIIFHRQQQRIVEFIMTS